MSSYWTVLGLGLPGSDWLRRVTEWSVSGALRLEFIKCVSVDEAIGRLAAATNPPAGANPLSGAPPTSSSPPAVLVDAVLAARHIELVEAAQANSAQVIVVGASDSKASNEALQILSRQGLAGQGLAGQGLAGQGLTEQGLSGVAYLADDFDHRQLAEVLQAGPTDFGGEAATHFGSEAATDIGSEAATDIGGEAPAAQHPAQHSAQHPSQHSAQHPSRVSYLNGTNAASSTGGTDSANNTNNTGRASGTTNSTGRASGTSNGAREGHLVNTEGHLPNTEGHLVAVMGRPGSGVSTTAIALAQGFSDHLREGSVLLADFSRYGDQALLHDSPDVVPGIQELVAEQANPVQANTGVRHLTYVIADRGYDLLLGLRRRRDWTSLRAAPLEAAVTAMRSEYQAVVADLDDDLEGKAETGSSDVQARNMAARHVALVADAVLVVGTTSLVGARSILQLIDDLHSLGVEPHKIRPLAIQLRQRSSQRQTQRSLSQMLTQNANLAAAGHIAEHRYVDDAHRNGTRMPSQLVTPALAAVEDLLGTLLLGGGQFGGGQFDGGQLGGDS